MTKFHELRVTNPGPTARTMKIWLDGLELRGVIDYALDGDMSGPNRLRLTLYVQSINDADETLRKLLEDK